MAQRGEGPAEEHDHMEPGERDVVQHCGGAFSGQSNGRNGHQHCDRRQ
jgi:hypothetical protein